MYFTTILPADDDKVAYATLNELIEKQTGVLLAIVGCDNWSEELVRPAERLACRRWHDRKVVWIKNIEPVREIIDDLFKDEASLKGANGDSFAFTISKDHKICDCLKPNCVPVSYLRLDDSFCAGEK